MRMLRSFKSIRQRLAAARSPLHASWADAGSPVIVQFAYRTELCWYLVGCRVGSPGQAMSVPFMTAFNDDGGMLGMALLMFHVAGLQEELGVHLCSCKLLQRWAGMRWSPCR